jgi:hypothetical protein
MKFTDTTKLAEELFLSILSRRPTTEEIGDVTAALQAATDRKTALEELVWALLASTEFRFNH